jgi:hypothetical protein
MRRIAVPLLAATLALASRPAPAAAQTFESLGTRAAGMGGAFVAVADDASAVYWNPAGLALGGAFFSLVLDAARGEADPDGQLAAGKQSSTLVSLATLPLGVSYYRSSLTRVSTAAAPPLARAPRYERLTTHHAGLTVVQSVTTKLAVASTLKAIRGVAASGVLLDGGSGPLDDLLDDDSVLPDRVTTRVTADVGAMARLGTTRLGLTVRNITAPDFDTPQGGTIELKRQSRAGIAYLGVSGLILAADADLEKARGPLGDVRNLAGGAELRLTPRALARAGLRFNTLSDQPGGHAPVGTIGGSFATIRSVFVDGQFTFGSAAGDRGWGIAARIVY